MEFSREHTAAFTGHRRYAGESDAMLYETVRTLYARGVRRFWSGMAVGFDLAAAETVAALRDELPGLQLGCAIPFPDQAGRFGAEDRMRHARLLACADEVAVVADRYDAQCYLRRDRWMVDRASVVVAWFDGRRGGTRYTWEYARRRDAERINLWRDPQAELF